MDKQEIFGLSLEELQAAFLAQGFKKFRAAQVFNWLYQKAVFDFCEMKNIAKADQELLAATFQILPATLKVLKEQLSSRDGTRKALLELADGNSVETVCMAHNYGCSVCVSSQVGCNMGCAFCASGINGAVRNLTKEEIILQVYYFNKALLAEGKRVSRIVVMGSGEPMLNLEATVAALKFLHEENTLNIGYRNMTVSTCGIVPGIERFEAEGLPISLAISLHAASDELRSELMPINKKYPFTEVIAAADSYAASNGRQVTYEYVLIANKNDSVLDAELLSNVLRFKNVSVNLIPVNPVEEKGFKRPSKETVERFLQVLTKNKINATVRREMGNDIAAACGQLRAQFGEQKNI
ncbi:MAG: 23S rRNA (adenine(2503)-C(2))-methyltransferase RlmN [Acidaminococcaceae bacterium]